jgi:UDP-GlcNAc:undecaprenyl-phosphate GlcNAc-1-phosphate transferase
MTWVLFSLALFAFLAALILTPLIRDLAQRFGFVDVPDQHRKLHKNPIPCVGGVAIFLSYSLAFVATLFSFKNVGFVLPGGSIALGLLLAIFLIFFTGLLDDLINLKAWQKLIGQLLAANVAYWSGVQIHVLQWHPLEFWISLPVTLLWLVACTNAFNLIDGLDGLAAGVGLFATITVVVAALTNEDLPLAIATVPLAGCLLGFLRYNFNPASVFLGDSGSLSIGFFLGCCGVLWSQKSATLLGMAAPLMAMAIPLLDVCLSIVRRFLRGQPVFGADSRHIHHLLLSRGFTTRRVALLLYGVCALAAGFSLIENALENHYGGLIVLLFCVGAWIGIQHLDYSEFGLATRLFLKGTFRQTIDVQFRLRQFERLLDGASSLDACCEVIQAGCRDFGFVGLRIKLHDQVREVIHKPNLNGQWQLRISLPNSQYVNLYREFESDTEPPGLAGFAGILDRGLQRWLARSVCHECHSYPSAGAAASCRGTRGRCGARTSETPAAASLSSGYGVHPGTAVGDAD